VQNVAFSLSGNAFVLGIGFILTPIIARIYGPDIYGKFALFAAIASFIQPISTLQYPSGFVAMNKHNDLSVVLQISLIALVSTTAITTLVVYILNLSETGYKLDYSALMLLPLYVLVAGLFNISRGLNVYLEEFKRSATSKSVATIVGKSSTIGLGLFIMPNISGMILGGIAAFLSETIGYFSRGFRSILNRAFSHFFSARTYYNIFKKYSEYPIFVTSNTLANSLSNNLPVFVLSLFFTTTDIGIYSLALNLVTIPINLIGTSVGSVFLPKISDNLKDLNKASQFIKTLYTNLYFAAAIGLLLLAVLYYYLLPIILGPEWCETSRLATVIIIGYNMQIVAIPLSVIYRLLKIERLNLALTIFAIIGRIIGLGVGIFLNDFYLAVALNIVVGLIHSALQVYMINRKFLLSNQIHIVNSVASTILLIGMYIILYSK